MLPKPFQHAWMDTDIGVFRDQVRRYIERELSPHVPTWRAQGYVPRETWRGFGEHGFLLPEMDEQWGGGGGNLAYQLVVQEELTRAEIHAITSVHTITAHYIDTYGTPEQKQRWLPRLCSGEMLAGIAMTEPSVGSDLLRVVFEVASFTLKTVFFLWLFVWVRWTLPRFRYDQLMDLGWKVMLPLSLVNIFATGFLIYYGVI